MSEGTNELSSSGAHSIHRMPVPTRAAGTARRPRAATPTRARSATSQVNALEPAQLAPTSVAESPAAAPRQRAVRPPRVPRAASPVVVEQPALDFAASSPIPSIPSASASSPALPIPPARVPALPPAPASRRDDRRDEKRGDPLRSPLTSQGMAGARVMPSLPVGPYVPTQPALTADPDVWLIALATAAGGLRSLDGADCPGAIRVSRPYGHLRSLRPVLPPEVLGATASGAIGELEIAGVTSGATRGRRSRGLGSGSLASGALQSARSSSRLPAERIKPQLVTAVEIETDAGLFRVERPQSVLAHTDLAWALANLEPGEPESLVPMPRRRLALLLTLLPTPADPEHPEDDPVWGWAHRLKAPWERGPLHPRGRLGRLIAVDPDPSPRGMHRACFEILGSDEVVWALGVPCYRTDSVYELVPLRRSRWLSWPLAKGRSKTGDTERPEWEIARVVYRVGAPRWPLAGVVEPLGPLGVAG